MVGVRDKEGKEIKKRKSNKMKATRRRKVRDRKDMAREQNET